MVPHRIIWSWYTAVDGWTVTYGTARRRLGGAPARPGPSSLYSPPINGQCTNHCIVMIIYLFIIIINDSTYPAVSKASRTGNKVSCQSNDCPNRRVFKRCLKMASDGAETMSAGRSFQTRGTTAPKARSPIVRSRVRRTSSFWVVADRSRLRESSVSAHCRSLAR